MTANTPAMTNRTVATLPNRQPQAGVWSAYAAAVWALLFAVVHVYWAMGGARYYEAFTLPPNLDLATDRDWRYVVPALWGVGGVCVIGAVAALATIRSWGRLVPCRVLRFTLWGGAVILALRAISNTVQNLLIRAGVNEFDPGALEHEWDRWMMWDLVLFSSWFLLGAVLYGVAAWNFTRGDTHPFGRRA